MPALFLCGCGLPGKNADTAGADAAQPQASQEWHEEPVPYKVEIVCDGPPYLLDKMKSVSQLEKLAKEPPDSMLALERRAREDQETAVKLLNSQCFYDGKASFKIEDKTRPAFVTLTLNAGPQYAVGRADVVYDPSPVIPKAFKNRYRVVGFWGLEKKYLPPPSFPETVPGVEIGKPVVAEDMLNAVAEIPAKLRNNGYPLAKVEKSLYTLDRAKRLLNAAITIDPGPAAVMGDLKISGDKTVHQKYLRELVPWVRNREPWDSALLEDYANNLRALGLFNRVDAKPDVSDLRRKADGAYEGAVIVPVDLSVVEGPPRSVGFIARYDSDTGLGVEGTWEHRNLFGNGEKIYLDAPISQEESGLKAHFEKPAFLNRDQQLLLDGAALWENTDAYQQQLVRGSAAIQRRIAPNWWGNIEVFAEGGSLKDNEHSKKEYGVFSPRGRLRYDGRNNRLNPSQGWEMDLKLRPFYGFYEEGFGAFAGRLTLAGYYAPLGHKNDGEIDDTIVLAARVEGGAMGGASALRTIPASLRYYTGGAGSVRGYPYQSIGPRDSEGDPLGGRSYQVVNLEARFMVAKNFGIVPFLDGGMVYKDEFPQIIGDMNWGTGLGLRYYTPIGPVRLDVATPLQPKDDDPPVQFYISIGQSF